MQMFLDLSPIGQARVWLDEVAAAPWKQSHPEDSGSTLQEEISMETRGWFLLDEVSIEVNLTQGERPAYGLLGCSFERRNAEGTSIRVIAGLSESSECFPEALGGSPETTCLGLSQDLAIETLKGAKAAIIEKNSTPAGTLTFATGASRPSDADPRLFGRLASLCVQLLDMAIESDEEACSALVSDALSDWPLP